MQVKIEYARHTAKKIPGTKEVWKGPQNLVYTQEPEGFYYLGQGMRIEVPKEEVDIIRKKVQDSICAIQNISNRFRREQRVKEILTNEILEKYKDANNPAIIHHLRILIREAIFDDHRYIIHP